MAKRENRIRVHCEALGFYFETDGRRQAFRVNGKRFRKGRAALAFLGDFVGSIPMIETHLTGNPNRR